MERPYRRARVWKIVVALAAGLSMAIGGLALWFHFKITLNWAAMEARTAELLSEALNRKPRRPPPKKEALPGNAWDEYELALAEVIRMGKDKEAFAAFNNSADRIDRHTVVWLLSGSCPALEHLKCGVRRRDLRNPRLNAWLTLWDTSLPLEVFSLAELAVSKALLLAESKKTEEAAELLLDVCRFGCDLGQSGPFRFQFVALGVYSTALKRMVEVLKSGPVSAEESIELERDLEDLERSLPRHSTALRDDLVLLGSQLMRDGPRVMDEWFRPRPLLRRDCWRYLFSPRLVGVNLFNHFARDMEIAARWDCLPWAQSALESKPLEAAVEASRNPIILSTVALQKKLGGTAALVYRDERHREIVARLRLLRIMIHHRATGQLIELEDPFGEKIHHACVNGRLKLWSVGADGVDDGGSGEWIERGKDIVLEINP